MKRFTIIAVIAVVIGASGGCASLDVVRTDAVRAFGDAVDAYPPETNETGWRLASPDENASFYWNGKGAYIEITLRPFADAGLDASKLDAQIYRPNELGTALFIGDAATGDAWGDSAKSALQAYIKANRGKLGYHDAMAHYNLDFGAAMFEWAKDLTTNDKDFVYALDPVPLTEAGLDPNNVEGWAYAEVPVMADGKERNEYKLLKSFEAKYLKLNKRYDF